MNEKAIVKLEWKGQRVLLTKQVAKYYEATEKQIRDNFNNNKDRFIEGTHYFKLNSEEIKQFLPTENFDLQISAKTRSLMLWTEKGCMLIAKSLGTDRAWEQYNYLVEYYFATEKALNEDGAIVADADKFVEKYFSTLPEETKIVIKGLLQEIENRDKELAELRPKRDYYDNVMHRAGLITTTDIAKDLGMSAKRLHIILHDLGFIFKKGKEWFLYSKYQNLIPEYADYHITEHGQTLKWTEKGREFIIKLLKENNIIN